MGQNPESKGYAQRLQTKALPRTSVHPPDGLPRDQRGGARDTAAAEHESSVRWTVEPFHRERKQLTGVQACQCRLARSQRNHIALAVRAWTQLKQAAYQAQETVYQLKKRFWMRTCAPNYCSQPWLLRKPYTCKRSERFSVLETDIRCLLPMVLGNPLFVGFPSIECYANFLVAPTIKACRT